VSYETLLVDLAGGVASVTLNRPEVRNALSATLIRELELALATLEAEGVVRTERDQVRLASHAIRLTSEQQRIVEGLEEIYRSAGAAPPNAEDALGRLGIKGTDRHELFQLLVADRRLLRVKESLFFHAAALGEIQVKVVAHLKEKKEIGPADVKDLLGVSRKYAIPLMEYFDSQRVTVRQGERRVLRTP